jgi:tetratricopeptide (TPR) repeat protein
MRGTLATTVLALALAGSAAHAQAPVQNPAADAALAEGRRLYDLQEWDKAIAKFKEAYSLREDAAALFNIAQSYRLKGDCAQAASFYKTFKRKFPDEKNIDKVEKFIVDMDTCAKHAKPDPSTTGGTGTTTDPKTTDPKTTDPKTTDPKTTSPIDPNNPGVGSTGGTGSTGPTGPIGPIDHPSGGGGLRIASYMTMGAGGAALVVGAVFGMKARGAANDAEALGEGDEWNPSIQERGQRNQKIATISLVAGGVLAAGGVAMFLLSRETSGEGSQVSITPTADGAQLVWGGSF